MNIAIPLKAGTNERYTIVREIAIANPMPFRMSDRVETKLSRNPGSDIIFQDELRIPDGLGIISFPLN